MFRTGDHFTQLPVVRETFEEREVALFEGGVDVAAALLELPVNHIFFTRSTRVAKLVMQAAAKHIASLTLELRARSPFILDRGADIDPIGAVLAQAKQFNAGQACVSPDFVFVPEEQQPRLVEAFRKSVAEEPAQRHRRRHPRSRHRPIVNARNFARVKGLFDDAVAKGAQVVVGGARR
jgi:aldehyde dehydrogenase (NAD+)